MKILLVDDDESILNSLRRLLEDIGHVVETSNTAEAGARMIETGGFDFALVDFKMPVHDGIWFMQTARIPKTTKVLLLTAFVNRKIIDEMFRLGVRGYLIKPISREELLTHIEFHSRRNDPASLSDL